MEKKTGVRLKSLSVVPEDASRKQGRVDALLTNEGRNPSPQSVLLLYFYDADNRTRDRISIRVPAVEPGQDRQLSAVFRLKSTGLFTYTAELRAADAQ